MESNKCNATPLNADTYTESGVSTTYKDFGTDPRCDTVYNKCEHPIRGSGGWTTKSCTPMPKVKHKRVKSGDRVYRVVKLTVYCEKNGLERP